MYKRLKWLAVLMILIICMVLVGCQNGSTDSNTNATVKSPDSPSTSPITKKTSPTDVMEEDVLIVLNEDPQIHSPIQTLVSAELAQHYTISFKANMNRESVEAALSEQTSLLPYEPSKLQLNFDWKTDRKLQLTVQTIDPTPYGQGYQLDVTGAMTANGEKLEKSPAFKAILSEPLQIWRMTANGENMERISNFKKPYSIRSILPNEEHVLIRQYMEYCECDADLQHMDAVYSIKDKNFLDYPNELQTN